MKYLSVAVLLVLLLACARFAPAGEIADLHAKMLKDSTSRPTTVYTDYDDDQNDHGVSEIGIEHTACFGSCPIFTFLVKSDGTYRYHGEGFVERKGDFTGKVNTWQYARLAEFIKQSGYADLKESYAANVTDMPTIYTTVVIDGKRKVIRDYAHARPANLWAVEKLIDTLLLDAEWDQPAGPATKPLDK